MSTILSCSRMLMNHALSKNLKNGARFFLSDSYICQESWNKRLTAKEIQNVDITNFTLQLQGNLDRETSVSPTDIDIFANKLHEIDKIQLDFAQNIFYKFRQTEQCPHVLESTHHAIIRALLDIGETDRILDMLKDKFGYGLFLDYYTANMLMNHLLTKKQYYESAQVAYDLMLQEDFANPITRMLAWYSCNKHWRNTAAAIAEQDAKREAERLEQEENDKNEEEVYVVVKYIENPYYDDHWDLYKDQLFLGKTFLMVASDPRMLDITADVSELKRQESLLEKSYQLIGAALYEKFDKVKELLEFLRDDNSGDVKVAREAINCVMSTLNELTTREPPEEPKETAVRTIYDEHPYLTAAQRDEALEICQNLIQELETTKKIADVELSQLLEEKLKSVVSAYESHDIEQQQALHQRWLQERADDIARQIKQHQLEEQKLSIARRLKDLQHTEERLRYFEQERRIMLGIKRHPKVVEIEEKTEEEQFVEAPGERGKKK